MLNQSLQIRSLDLGTPSLQRRDSPRKPTTGRCKAGAVGTVRAGTPLPNRGRVSAPRKHLPWNSERKSHVPRAAQDEAWLENGGSTSRLRPSPSPFQLFQSNSDNDRPGQQVPRSSNSERSEQGNRGGGAEPMSSSSKNTFNGVFLLLLLNVAAFVVDHVFKVPAMRWLYLHHSSARWYQFVTATFCHASWNHLSSNLFFLYIFGRLVEEEEGSVGLWATYLVTGAGANIVSWLVLPPNVMSVGASGAVFGLFAVSVITRMKFNWRKLLEVVILGQFVVERLIVEAKSSAMVAIGRDAVMVNQGVNHVAHLAGALVGVLLMWLVSKIPEPGQSPNPRPQT